MTAKPVIIAHTPLSPWLRRGLEQSYDLCDAGAEMARDATVLVTNGAVGVDNATLSRLPALRLIAIHGVGYEKVDVEFAQARGIAVTITPDVLTDDVADMAVALTLATARNIARNDRMVRAGGWQAGNRVPLGRRVSGARIGIVGLGRIGHAIAQRLGAFNCPIAYHNRREVPDSPYHYHPRLIDLARDSDVLINVAAGGLASAKLINGAILNALGSEGIFVNVGRGATVDEDALIEALRTGAIAGAGLDVYADEPNVPAALIAMDQVTLQPHQGSATLQTRMAMADLVLANIAAHFAGKPLPTPVK
ncbi:2-hydroxyacid dehydrogenase [Niveispirillum irakense]|uniref:2-hydroxyacid dehydrogenase n=1 Tax=Niveispirillum irakense TaxID=34011 RepID=UPI000422918C|nr:2-hydroxyacid dehydrogenase [Niveispirillum irakense]